MFGKNKNVKAYTGPTEREPKLVLISGTEKSLYPFTLSLFLARQGGDVSVLTIDNSISQDLFSAIPSHDGVGTIDGVPVLSARKYTPEIMSQFDYTVVYTGYSQPDREYMKNANALFIISDYTLVSQKYLENIKIPKVLPVRFIFDSKPNNKLRENLILAKMKYYEVPKNAEFYTAYIDERDAGGYLELLNTGYVAPKALSKPFNKIISDMASDINNVRAMRSEDEGVEG